MPRINKTDEYEVIMPEHADGDISSGYYYFPDDKRIAVDRFGNTLDMVTGRHSVNYRKLNGLVISTRSGYDIPSYKIEYIMARTFVGRHKSIIDRPHKELKVNFISGVKCCVRPENLEWVTVSQMNYMRSKIKQPTKKMSVLSYNLKTDGITKWDSYAQAGRFFGISDSWMWRYLRRGTFERYHFNGFVFKFDDGSEWNFDKTNLEKLWKSESPISFKIYDSVKNITILADMEQISLVLDINLRDFNKARGLKKKFVIGHFAIEQLL